MSAMRCKRCGRRVEGEPGACEPVPEGDATWFEGAPCRPLGKGPYLQVVGVSTHLPDPSPLPTFDEAKAAVFERHDDAFRRLAAHDRGEGST